MTREVFVVDAVRTAIGSFGGSLKDQEPGELAAHVSRALLERSKAMVDSRFGHPSGTLRVSAEAVQSDGEWRIARVGMSRSARVVMEGWVRVPGQYTSATG